MAPACARVFSPEAASAQPDPKGTLRERQPGQARPRPVTRPQAIPSASGSSLVDVTRACPRFPPRRSMVRRGSSVRVRQRALQKRRKSVPSRSDRLAPCRTCGGYGAVYGAFRFRRPLSGRPAARTFRVDRAWYGSRGPTGADPHQRRWCRPATAGRPGLPGSSAEPPRSTRNLLASGHEPELHGSSLQRSGRSTRQRSRNGAFASAPEFVSCSTLAP